MNTAPDCTLILNISFCFVEIVPTVVYCSPIALLERVHEELCRQKHEKIAYKSDVKRNAANRI